ncbi:MAG: EamA family transporter [Lautropia sp.]|nr:EamA family transporter [Lautropia sp.]
MPAVTGTRQHRLAVATLVLCTLLWSTAGVVTRQLEHAGGFELTFWRSLSCVLFVGGYLIATSRSRWLAVVTACGVPGIVSGVMWAVMFTCFMIALTITTVAKTLVVMAVAPLLTAVLAWLVLKERIAPRTWMAVLVAGAGIVWMVRDGLQTGEGSSGLWGMLVAAGVPLASAVNLINMKRQQAAVDLVPAILIGGLISCLAMLPLILPTRATGHDILLLSILGGFQLGLPCILMIRAARYLSPQETALLSLLEVVFGPLWAWLGAGEQPAAATLYGGALILAALLANELLAPKREHANAAARPAAADPAPATDPAAAAASAGAQAVRMTKSKLA